MVCNGAGLNQTPPGIRFSHLTNLVQPPPLPLRLTGGSRRIRARGGVGRANLRERCQRMPTEKKRKTKRRRTKERGTANLKMGGRKGPAGGDGRGQSLGEGGAGWPCTPSPLSMPLGRAKFGYSGPVEPPPAGGGGEGFVIVCCGPGLKYYMTLQLLGKPEWVLNGMALNR